MVLDNHLDTQNELCLEAIQTIRPQGRIAPHCQASALTLNFFHPQSALRWT